MRIIKKIIMYLLLFMLCIFPISIFSSCISSTESSSFSPENEYIRDTIHIETSFAINLKPNEEKTFTFTSEFSGLFTIEYSASGNFTYYIYKAKYDREYALHVGDYTFAEKGEEYYLDIINTGHSNLLGAMRVSLKTIEKNEPMTVLLDAKEKIAYKYKCDNTEILDLISSENSVIINCIINLYNFDDNLLNIDLQMGSFKFSQKYTYIVELYNKSNSNCEAAFSIMDVARLPTSSNPSENVQYYYYKAETSGYYSLLLKYSLSNVGIMVLDENLINVPYSENFGQGYKALRIYLETNENVYIGFYDISQSNEMIDIKIDIENLL